VVVATYLTWIAARVDRLHHRADAAYASLEARLAQRAAATISLADVDLTLEDRATAVRAAARAALRPSPDGREATENELTRQLRELSLRSRVPVWGVAAGMSDADPTAGSDEDPVAQAVVEVVAVSRRVALARQVHNDLVRETLAARRRPVVRLLGLDRRHARPAYFDIEDPVLDG
jgi:uncharacterized tellurite resistance protein B-like protein